MDNKPPVLITWVDICSCDAAWMSLADALEYRPTPIQTLGWVLEENDEYVVVVSSYSVEEEDRVFGSVCAIPRDVIESIILLDTRNVC